MSSRDGGGRQAILIVGMHRSGTSAVTRVLNLLGVPLPPKLVGSFAGNELGHWEPAELPALHDRMLRDAGSNVNGVLGIDRGWFGSRAARDAADEVAAYLTETFPEAPLFALKDPRMALFVPVWRRALHQLGIAPRFVLPFRAPREVAASLTRRQLSVFTDSAWPPARGELVWLNYVLSAERDTRDAPRTFVRFDALLDDWRAESGRMADQLGLAWPRAADEANSEIEGYLSREHKHEHASDPAVTAVARAVWEQLERCAVEPYAGAEAFDAAARELDAGRALFGEYVSALESLLGALPLARMEFGDFPTPLEQAEPPGPDADAAQLRKALLRSQALQLGAAAERRVQAAALRDFKTLNTALTQTQLGEALADPAPASNAAALHGECERLREEADALRRAQAPLNVKLAAQRTQLEEQEAQLRDLRRNAESAEQRAQVLFDENEANKARLGYAQRDMDRVLRSTSWRLTAPVRKLRSLLSPRRASAS